MLFAVMVSLLVRAGELPEVCRAPPTRDVTALTILAQRSGALSVGLDSVATWCFDASGRWTGGAKTPVPDGEPIGDCAKALDACHLAHEAVAPELITLLSDSLRDLERPFLGARYVPKRSGLSERPATSADCGARQRNALFAQAQARMDWARLASQAQSEYANYRTWLYAEGLRCSEAVARAAVDPTHRGLAVDRPVSIDGGSLVLPGSALARTGSSNKEAVAVSALEVAAQGRAGATGELDVGPVGLRDRGPSGVVNSSTARALPSSGQDPAGSTQGVRGAVEHDVQRSASPVDAAVRVRPGDGALEALGLGLGATMTMDGPSARAAPPTMQATWQALAAGRARIELDEDWLSGFLVSRELRACHCDPIGPAEVLRRLAVKEREPELEADDERNVRCERCLQEAFVPWKSRVTRQCVLMARLTDFELGVLERSDDGNGLPPRCFASTRAQRSAVDAGVTRPPSGSSFIITRSPEAPKAPVELTPPAAIPPREEGRTYLRLYMSTTCVAEVEPGPVQLRTGDLLPVPLGASALWVKSACGGLAEVYSGREERPRVSETFGKNQPLELRFSR